MDHVIFLITLLIISVSDPIFTHVIDTSSKIKWVPTEEFNMTGHEFAGFEQPHEPIFVARIHEGMGQRIGTIQRSSNSVEVLVDGKGKDVGRTGQVLQYPRGAVTWAPVKDMGRPPPSLILAGFDPDDGEPTYICRAVHFLNDRRRVTPGTFKFSKATEGCEINHQSNSVWKKEFEVLALSFYGISIMSAAVTSK